MHVRDLEELEGPLLSEHRAGGATYIEKWCTCDETTQRTLIVRSDPRSITEYLGRRISMWELLVERSQNVGFLHDYTRDGFQRATIVEVSSLPKNYLPSARGYHDPALRPHWALVPQEFLVGEHWNAELLRDIERLYFVAHAFTFAAHHQPHLIHNVARVKLSGWNYPWALKELRRNVPPASRPETVGVSANSPGVLSMVSPRETAKEMVRAFSRLNDRRTKKAYHALHSWAKMDEADSKRVKKTAAEQDIARLCSALGITADAVLPPASPDATLPVDSTPDPEGLRGDGATEYRKREILQAGKLIAAYYRCLDRLLNSRLNAEFILDMSLVYEDDDDGDDDEDEDEYDENELDDIDDINEFGDDEDEDDAGEGV